MRNIDKLVTLDQRRILADMIFSLKVMNISLGLSERLYRAGEWGLCFKEIYYAAKKSPVYSGRWKDELSEMNRFFAQDDYLSSKCGFPLN